MKIGVAISLHIKGKLLFCARRRSNRGASKFRRFRLDVAYKDDCARL